MKLPSRINPNGRFEILRFLFLGLFGVVRLFRERWRDLKTDAQLGLKTVETAYRVDCFIHPDAVAPQSRLGDSHGFSSTHYSILSALAECLDIGPKDVFLDLGCGAGRAVCYMSHRGVRRSIGTDVDAELVSIAERNAAVTALRTGRPVDILRCDAAGLPSDVLDEATVFHLFNPFGENTLRAWLDLLQESLRRHERSVAVAYFFPQHAWLLGERLWLSQDHDPRLPMKLGVWRSINPLQKAEQAFPKL